MADIQTTIVNDVNWLKHHIIALVVVAVLVAGAVYGVESLMAKHDAAREAKDEQLLALVTQQTNALKQQLATDEAATAQKDLAYQATIQEKSATIAKLQSQLEKQLQVNATLNAQQTAAAIAQKTNATDVSAQGDNVILGLPTARVINSDIDKLNTVSQQLEDRTQQLIAQTGLTSDSLVREGDAKKIIASQQDQLKQADKTCNDKIDTAKWVSRKSKGKWFLAGVVVGFIGRQILRP